MRETQHYHQQTCYIVRFAAVLCEKHFVRQKPGPQNTYDQENLRRVGHFAYRLFQLAGV